MDFNIVCELPINPSPNFLIHNIRVPWHIFNSTWTLGPWLFSCSGNLFIYIKYSTNIINYSLQIILFPYFTLHKVGKGVQHK